MSLPKSIRRPLVILAVFVTLIWVFEARVFRKMPDFEVYWKAGSRVLRGEPLYRPEDGHYQFKYFPAFALMVAPLALLPLGTAKALWFAFSVSLIPTLLTSCRHLLPEQRVRSAWLIGLTTVAMMKFYGHELVLGQSNLLMAALVVWTFAELRRERFLLAGSLLTLAVVIKPYAVLFLIYLVSKRLWRCSVTFTILLLLVLTAPAMVYGFDANLMLVSSWWQTVTGTSAGTLTSADNISIPAMYVKWIGLGRPASILAWTTLVVLWAICLTLVHLVTTSRFPGYLDMSLFLILIPLTSPQGWDYVLLIATPAVMLLIDRIGAASRGSRILIGTALFLIGFSAYDVMGRQLYAQFMWLSMITVCSLVLFRGLVELRLRRVA